MKFVSIEKLRAVAAVRPAGYLEEMISSGTVRNGAVQYDDATIHRLKRKYRPTLLAMGIDLARAGTHWPLIGKPLRSQAGYDAVRVICGQCPHYSSDLFRHHCKVCKCGDLLPQLAASKCPDKPPRWGPEITCPNGAAVKH